MAVAVKKLWVMFLAALAVCLLLCGVNWAHDAFGARHNPFVAVVGLVILLVLFTPLVIWLFRRGRRGMLRFTPAQLFLMGGLCWLMAAFFFQVYLGNSTLDIQLHDIYYTTDVVTDHSMNAEVMAVLFFVFAGIYEGYRRIARRPLTPWMGYVHFLVDFVIAYLFCWPGILTFWTTDTPLQYIDYSNGWFIGVEWAWNTATVVFILANALFLFNLVYTSFRCAGRSGGPEAAVLIGLILLISACHKEVAPAADPYDLAQNSADQNAQLIKGYWIEDSVHVEGIKTFITLPPSYLRIDDNLHYSMYQTVTGNPSNSIDTGYLVFDGNRNIQPISVGGNHYLSGFDRLVISRATDHVLVLYDYEAAANNFTLYYHK